MIIIIPIANANVNMIIIIPITTGIITIAMHF